MVEDTPMKKRISFLLVFALLLSLCACAGNKPSAHPEGYESYRAVLAKDWDVALDTLKLADSVTSHVIGLWNTGITVDYCGVPLNVWLWSNYLTPDWTIFSGFSYTGTLSSDRHEAAQTISAIAKQITQEHGPANERAVGEKLSNRFADLTVEEIEELLEPDKRSDRTIANPWLLDSLTTPEGKALADWTKETNPLNLSSNANSGFLDHPQFILYLSVQVNTDGTMLLQMKYGPACYEYESLIP